jgi:hypothetical protein
VGDLKVTEKCKAGVLNLLHTMEHIPSLIQDRVRFFSKHAKENDKKLEGSDSADRLKAFRVVASGIKHYMLELGQKVKDYIPRPHMPDITLSNLLQLEPGQILNDVSRIPLYIHMVSAVICLSLSAIFHLFYCHSKQTSTILCRLDYAGVSILIGGSVVPPNVYGFYCQENHCKSSN